MPQSDAPLSLTDYAASLKSKPACRVCELAEVDEINAARAQGVSYDNIVRWLAEVKGYEPGFISVHRVERHFGDKHNG